MKYYLGILLLVTIAACSNSSQNNNAYVVISGSDDTTYLKDIEGCPKVHVRHNDVKIIQNAEYQELFEIKAVGYEGYCYYNEAVAKNRAVVKPKFRITRLTPSDITDVDFSYYLETVEGPAKYLGQKTYFASVNVPLGTEGVTFTAEAGELGIPQPGTYNLDIYLGLNDNRHDSEHK